MSSFNSLFAVRYATSQDAIEECQRLAYLSGFSVRIRTSQSNCVYLVCSREGKPRVRNTPRKHSRNILRCHCGWRVVLFYNDSIDSFNKWEFKSGTNMNHNHELGSQASRCPPVSIQKEKLNTLPPINHNHSASNSLELPSLRSLFEYLQFNSTSSEENIPSSI